MRDTLKSVKVKIVLSSPSLNETNSTSLSVDVKVNELKPSFKSTKFEPSVPPSVPFLSWHLGLAVAEPAVKVVILQDTNIESPLFTFLFFVSQQMQQRFEYQE